MATKYVTLSGSREAAELHLLRTGGQLYPGRSQDHPSTVVCGSVVTTYWPPGSKLRGQVIEIAKVLGQEAEHATVGRLGRTLVNDILQLPYQGTYFGLKWRSLAIGGTHWHYQHVRPGKYEYAMEIDLRSAYFASLVSQESLLLNQHGQWLDDNGALENLKTLMPLLPKPFRLALLGQIASWRNYYYTVDKTNPDASSLILKCRKQIKFGAAFNAVHRAILHVYKTMERCHLIIGDDCVRVHTDGMIVDCCNGMKWESELDDFLRAQGFEYSIKGQGSTWLYGLNCGIIGRKVMGVRTEVAGLAREAGVKIDLNATIPRPSIFLPEELPAGVGSQIDVNPAAVYSQTALDF